MLRWLNSESSGRTDGMGWVRSLDWAERIVPSSLPEFSKTPFVGCMTGCRLHSVKEYKRKVTKMVECNCRINRIAIIC
jgi:hypothetical protein